MYYNGVEEVKKREIKEPLATVWPALTEALYLLNDLPAGQEAVWESILRGTIGILPLDAEDIPSIRELMRKYRDRGMELADAALIRAAEREDVRKFFCSRSERLRSIPAARPGSTRHLALGRRICLSPAICCALPLNPFSFSSMPENSHSLHL